MDAPDVRYARAGGVAIAYQVAGDGEQTLVVAPHLCEIESLWEVPHLRRFLDVLLEQVRVVVFNARGTGLSDRPRTVTLESRMDDVAMVLDAIGVARAPLLGVATGANTCALFAATHPERCERLVLTHAYPRAIQSAEYPHGMSEEDFLAEMREIGERWGDREYLEAFFRGNEPVLATRDPDLMGAVTGYRRAVSPAGAVDFYRLNFEMDITGVLSSIRVPTLVLHSSRDQEVAAYLGARIPDAQVSELHELGGSPYSDEAAATILGFLRGDVAPAVPDSVLATVLFTDIVGSTEHAAQVGDRAWSDLLNRHHTEVRRELARHRGAEVDTAGDGFFCRFDGPARAIACARRIVEGASELGLEVRAGIHTGECELVGEKIAGIAVVTGSRISSLAAPGEVLVSSTVKDLVVGAGLTFEDRGEHGLKGVPDAWRIYRVA
jgi:class 3 adenylate cyclase